MNIATYIYDELGNKTSYVNENGEITKFVYDRSSNLINKIQHLADDKTVKTKYGYDELNRLVSIADANNN